MKSMTGYGKATYTDSQLEVEVEIKSINARYLDFKAYLPRDIGFYEFQLRKLISQFITRGTVEVRINITDHREPNISLNYSKLSRYNDIIKEAIDRIGVNSQVPIELLIKEPGIIENKRSADEDADLNKALNECVNHAIINLLNCLEMEGRDIRDVLTVSLNRIAESLIQVESLVNPYRDSLFLSMKKRISDILSNVQAEVVEQRLLQELAIYIDKYDIHEEITRLRSHLESMIRMLNSNSPDDVGKNLNFIMQEMQREANTLGSKFSTPESFQYILVIKEEVEKCREIIQNVA